MKIARFVPWGKMSDEVLVCSLSLIELKIFLVAPNTIYFYLKKVSEDAINV